MQASNTVAYKYLNQIPYYDVEPSLFYSKDACMEAEAAKKRDSRCTLLHQLFENFSLSVHSIETQKEKLKGAFPKEFRAGVSAFEDKLLRGRAIIVFEKYEKDLSELVGRILRLNENLHTCLHESSVDPIKLCGIESEFVKWRSESSHFQTELNNRIVQIENEEPILFNTCSYATSISLENSQDRPNKNKIDHIELEGNPYITEVLKHFEKVVSEMNVIATNVFKGVIKGLHRNVAKTSVAR